MINAIADVALYSLELHYLNTTMFDFSFKRNKVLNVFAIYFTRVKTTSSMTFN